MGSSERLPSYYSILGVNAQSSDEEIRRAYRKLAMQWHPDKWTNKPTLLGEAKQKFQQIQEAYSVLSDRNKRTMYNAGLYDPDDDEEEIEGFADFLEEMVSLMDEVRKEGKTYSGEELQSMFWEMAKGFEIPQWTSSPQQSMYEFQWCSGHSPYSSGTAMGSSWEASLMEGSPHLHGSAFEMCTANRFW
ncbi:chaperone protein DnaJ-like [Forsythia ovata]|uniref:Chaperone protein DnaJ-like n=1 Tax=Forsythia ovata TaxID=205694 RepID=A0ABD1WC89_9LAMI